MKKRFVFLGVLLCIVLVCSIIFSSSAFAYQEVIVGECTFQIPREFHVWERERSTAFEIISDSADYVTDDLDYICIFSIESNFFPNITTPESIIDTLRKWKQDAEENGETDCKYVYVGDCSALLSHEENYVNLRILNRYEEVVVMINSHDAEKLKNYEETLIPLIDVSLTPVR